MVGEIEREHGHEATQRLDAGHDQRGGGEQHFLLGELIAVELGRAEMRDQVVAWIGAAPGDYLRRIVAHPLIGRDVLRPFLARDRIRLHHQHRLVAHQLVVARRQTEQAEQYLHRYFAGKVADEIEGLLVGEAGYGLARCLADMRLDVIEVALVEGVLDEPAQAVVARRIGGAEGSAGAIGQFVHQIALGRRIGLPVVQRT